MVLTGEANTNDEKVKSRQNKSLLVNVVKPDGHDTQQKKLNYSYEKLCCFTSSV